MLPALKTSFFSSHEHVVDVPRVEDPVGQEPGVVYDLAAVHRDEGVTLREGRVVVLVGIVDVEVPRRRRAAVREGVVEVDLRQLDVSKQPPGLPLS